MSHTVHDRPPLSLGGCRASVYGPRPRRMRRKNTSSTTEQMLRPSSFLVKGSVDNSFILFHTDTPIPLPADLTIEASVKLRPCEGAQSALDLSLIARDFYQCSNADYDSEREQISLKICSQQAQERASGELYCLVRISSSVEAALSLSLLVHATHQSATRPTNKRTSLTVNPALLQAAIKRSIVGTHILWSRKEYTTEVRVKVGDTLVLVRVQSVLANQSNRRIEPNHFIILPSTRITIDLKQEECDNQSSEQRLPSPHSSPAITLLLQTMDCIRRFPHVSVTRSFLFSGPPGTGKTFAIRVAAEQMGEACQLTSLNGSEIMASGQGGPEAAQALERIFCQARQASNNNNSSKPVVLVFLDEFDALIESDYVMAMLALILDRVAMDSAWRRFVVVAATNRIASIPAHLRRPGRFDKEVVFHPPTLKERQSMLVQIINENGGLGRDLDVSQLEQIAEKCVGFVPADLVALVRKALLLRLVDPDATADAVLDQALSFVGASALRDAAMTAPPATDWSDIIGDCGGAKLALQQAVEWPRTRRQAFQSLGLQIPRGCLLYGAPGTGKTLLARAAAGSSGVAFLALSPADIYASSYVGDAEAIIRKAFASARAVAPCILFFDEIDSILGFDENVSQGMSRGHSAEARTLSTFLNEMDGIDGSLDDGVMVLGATNRPETIDRALLRPGRFDKVIHVPPPDFVGRRSILEVQCRGWQTKLPMNFDYLASEEVSGGMTGAELVGACREVAMALFQATVLTQDPHFDGEKLLLDVLNQVCGGQT